MNWIRILNKVGLTASSSYLPGRTELDFNALNSPVLQFLNDVGLIVVPSEILPSSARLRRLHRSIFVVGFVALSAVAVYIRLNVIPYSSNPRVRPSATRDGPADTIAPGAEKPIEPPQLPPPSPNEKLR